MGIMVNTSIFKTPDRELIQDAAIELGVDASFVEKDWYAVQLLRAILQIEELEDVKLCFSGGTSLSKGFGLIQRFSEDLDFFLRELKPLDRRQRRQLRKILKDGIEEPFQVLKEESLNESRSMKFWIEYPKAFHSDSIRPHLQLELTFFQPRAETVKREIRSFINELAQEESEATIDCVSAVETAANKLSALTWRVLSRDRSSRNDDPSIIRHLHDLSALHDVIMTNKSKFLKLAKESFQDDRNRGSSPHHSKQIVDRIYSLKVKLSQDPEYKSEYQQFVMEMSYSDLEESISFESALSRLDSIAKLFS